MSRRSFLKVSVPAGVALALEARPALARETPTSCRVVSASTGLPVPGARLRAAGEEVQADDSGRAELTGLVFPWTHVEIGADGFLVRRTCVREGGDLSLWPVSPEVPSDWVRAVVYGEAGVLVRPVARVADVVAHGALAERAACQAAIRKAAAAASEAFGMELRVIGEDEAGEASAERPRVDLVVDPADSLLASTGSRAVFSRRTRGAAIVGGHLAMSACAVAEEEGTLLHELGHLFLLHSPDPGDLMAEGGVDRGTVTFSPRERALLKLMRQRLPGNRPEDDDRELGPRASRVAEGSILHRIVYAPSLRADAVFGVRRSRQARAAERSVVCCA
jgi:hypothetical protein